jgi:hypothetical protein
VLELGSACLARPDGACCFSQELPEKAPFGGNCFGYRFKTWRVLVGVRVGAQSFRLVLWSELPYPTISDHNPLPT